MPRWRPRPESGTNLIDEHPSHRRHGAWTRIYAARGRFVYCKRGGQGTPKRCSFVALGHPYLLGPRDSRASSNRPFVLRVLCMGRMAQTRPILVERRRCSTIRGTGSTGALVSSTTSSAQLGSSSLGRQSIAVCGRTALLPSHGPQTLLGSLAGGTA